MPPAAPPRALLRALVAGAALLAVAVPAQAAEPETANFDARPQDGNAPTPRQERAREALRERLGRFGLVATEPGTGAPRAVARLNGFLTGPSGSPGADVALDYVRGHADAFGLDVDDLDGLRLTRRSFSGGIEYLSWEQRYRGIPSADTQLDAAVTGSGRLLSVTGPTAPDLAVESIEPVVGAESAYAAVRNSGRASHHPVAVQSRAAGAERETTFVDGGSASLTLYQGEHGARLAWRVLAPVDASAVFDALVDARSGAVVRRANRVDAAAEAKVFLNTPRVPATQQTVTFPDAWLPPGATTLQGPNAHAFVDPTDHVDLNSLTPRTEDEVRAKPDGTWNYNLVSGFSTSPANGCSFSRRCTWDRTSANSWQASRNQSATQLFYFVNTFRDHLAQLPIDFNDASFGGNDPVLAQSMDGASGPNEQKVAGLPDSGHVNNAGFLTLPDGTPGQLQAHLFSHATSEGLTPFGDFDAANDASVIFHEYTHGLSNRLVTDAQGFGALNTVQAGAIGEGTSDFYALDYLVDSGLIPDQTDDPDIPDDAEVADVRLGTYLDNGNPAGLRYQAIDCDVNSPDPACAATDGTDSGGFTYDEFGLVFGTPEVHSDGEIWAQTLWDLRQALGVQAARRVITTALRLSPPEPSFLDMRNAILEAGDADEDALVWQVFAARGMGYFASSDGSRDIAPVADFQLPPEGPATGQLSGEVRDDEGAPVANATVGIAGHDTSRDDGTLGPYLADDTDSDGLYSIAAPEGIYPLVIARHAGLRDDRETGSPPGSGVTIAPDTQLDFELVRDWSSGAEIERFTGPDNTESGCGPDGLVDDEHGTVWGSDRQGNVGQTIVIDLGAPIDVAGVAIDPGAGCGDDPSAGLKDFAIRGSTSPDAGFRSLGSGAFPELQGGFLRDVPGSAATAVRYIELQAKTPQSTGGAGARYLDVAELHVAKTPFSVIGPTVETGGSYSVGISTATMTGTVTPHGDTADVVFQYGLTTAYGLSAPAGTLGPGETAKSVAAAIPGLAPSTTYHYRVVARRGGKDYPGADRTFTTGAAPPPPPTPTPTPAPPPPPPTPSPAPTPTPDPGPPVTATRFDVTKLSASRKGLFKVRVRFGSGAPAGTARLTVRAGKKRVAKGKLAVRAGRASTKTLRLTSKGRRLIKPGKSRKVTLKLRLPGGEKLKKSIRLTRKKR